MKTLSSLVLTVFAFSCGGSVGEVGPSDDLQAQINSAIIGESEQTQSRVYLLGSGSWSKYVYHGFTRESFWVDLSVRNDGAGKEVGIAWSTDGWVTSNRTLAQYKETLPNGRERWGLDVVDFAGAGPASRPQVEFAAFVTTGGTTSWSPFRNHFIYQPVTPEAPVRLMRSAIVWNNGVAKLEGTTRTLRTKAARTVTVRYTLDGWKTSRETRAVVDGEEHSFSIPLAIDARFTDEVVFAVRFESGGQSAWDNAQGANYRHQLAPKLTASMNDIVAGQAFDGIIFASGSATTAFAVGEVQVRVDSKPWERLPGYPEQNVAGSSGFAPQGGFSFLTNTAGLSRGAHRLSFRAVAGPYTRELTLPFTVANRIAVGSAQNIPTTLRTAWDIERSAAGVVWVAGDQVGRLDGAAPVLESSDVRGYFLDIELTDTSVFALSNGTTLVKWNQSTGRIERSFGTNGTLTLRDMTYGGLQVCFSSSFAATASALLVADSCNMRLLRLSLDGAFIDELRLAADQSGGIVQLPVVVGNRVWVSYGSELVALSLTGSLSVVERIQLADKPNPESFSVTSDGFWLTTGADLRKYSRQGAQTARWVGGNLNQVAPGVLSIAKHVEVQADGSIELLSVQTQSLERFRTIP